MNNFKKIYEDFCKLKRPNSNRDTYNVLSLPDLPHKLGVSYEGHPKFFVRTNNSALNIQNIIRNILSVQYDMKCHLVDNDIIKTDDNFSIITLQTTDKHLQSYFIEIFTMMLIELPKLPTNKELAIEIEKLISIFSALTKEPKKLIQGLWAELLIIERSKNPEVLINAWHSSPSAKYDFTMGRDKIEVKSTKSEQRNHQFSLDQLNPSPNSRLLIASTIVRESAKEDKGLSIRNLYDRICSRGCSINASLHLYKIIAETLGSNLAKLENVYFDYTSAVDFLEFYDYHSIPRIIKSKVPKNVTEVKFTSNLDNLTDVRKLDSAFDLNTSQLFKNIG